MITVYTLAFQEEVLLPSFILHYRALFPGCAIVVYSNESSDKTDKIALDSGCELRIFKTGNTLSDRTYLEIKNSCWKSALTDWVLVADVDERLFITERQLREEEAKGSTIIKSQGYNMVSDNDDQLYDPLSIRRGIRSVSYDKIYLFNKKYIKETNYIYGCHNASPIGKIKYSTPYQCRHFKYYNLAYMIARHAMFAKRLSDHNKKHGLGFHYTYSPEEITKEFNEARNKAVVI